MRLKLTIAYDGRPFRGWQSQVGGATVQDTIQGAIGSIAGDGDAVPIQGSGRTDTGVHALGQIAHFDAPPGNRMEAADWRRALNAHLPPSVRILDCVEAAADFHSRFDAVGKEYRYRIHTAETLPPLLHGLAWHLPQGLDATRLEEACQAFAGTHDFGKFAANRGTEVKKEPYDPVHTTRTIHAIHVDLPEPDRIDLRFHGTGFLYKMVRLLTGSAVRCAQGKAGLDWLRGLLDDPASPEPKSSYCAPAEGLYLVRVHYA